MLTEGDLDDAHKAIDAFRGWINNADTKAGLLSAGVAALVAGVTQQRTALGLALSPNSAKTYVALAVLIIWLSAIIVVVTALGFSLIPRLDAPPTSNRFAFPTVARWDWSITPADRETAAGEAWAEARVLAIIASNKFRGLKVAFPAFGVALVLFLAWTCVGSILI